MVAALWSLMVAPAAAHGENDARSIARDAQLGPYAFTLWQVIGDHGAQRSAHVVVDFGDHAPAKGTSLIVAVDSAATPLVATRSGDVPGMWQTAGAVGFGDVIRVGLVDGDTQWWSSPFEVPQPPGETLVGKAAFSLALFASTLVLVWMGRRTRQVWSRPRHSHPVNAS